MLSSVATDMQGNASADIGTLPPFDSVLFVVSDSSGTQFLSFIVGELPVESWPRVWGLSRCSNP